MRDYIHKHQSEFVPEGIDVAEVEETAEAQGEALKTPVLDKTPLSEEQAAKEREHERNRRSMQWAYDTFEGAFKVAKQSTEGALELIRDAWDQSSSVTILYFVIAILVVSNIWTLMMMGKREEVGRRKELRRMEEREKWVQGVVTALWDELTTTRGGAPSPNPYQVVQQPSVGGPVVSGGSLPPFVRPPGGAANWREEVTEINRALDMVEERVAGLKESMKDLKDLD
ncbi:hypothetical protein NLI96_g5720 [Meripilus lineatus]|uniref:Uncharacterized protein n=1 Tax=Meripilus lineatus TaxID=2056292 RepID=A0AAD5V778_9APHY|nr:hypothetical protein NLI96_g5720 [Physisporinus lineatus]